VKDSIKKQERLLGLSKVKIILILIIICCLILGGLSPTINSILIYNNKETLKVDYDKKNNEEYKETNYDNDVWATASFYWRPQYPDPSEIITFYSNSYAINGFITSEKWAFSDGYNAYGRMVTHSFEKKDSYKVTLSVTASGYNLDYDWSHRTSYIEVGGDPFPKIKCIPEYPSPGEEVKLDGSGSYDPDGKIIYYKWSYYEVSNPENVFDLGSDIVIYYKWEKQGTYTVLLYTEDDKGNNNTLERIIDVSILKLIDFDAFSKGLNFKISNSGNITANNIKWDVKIYRYTILGTSYKSLYQKSNKISTLNPGDSQTIELKNIQRKLCKIKIVVTAEAENAVKISKTYYGRIVGKFIYITENDFGTPLVDAFKFLMFAGAILTILSFIIFTFSNIY
jgi:hypothetical protein